MSECVLFERRASSVLSNWLRNIGCRGIWLLPANICPIVPAVFRRLKIPVEFVDISQHSKSLDLQVARKQIISLPSKYAGVFFARTYGYNANVDAEFEAIREIGNNIKIIDDRCLCVPMLESPGKVADLYLYSTGYSKYVDKGWGGWGFVRDSSGYSSEVSRFSDAAHLELQAAFREKQRNGGELTALPESWLDTRAPDCSWSIFKKDVELRALKASEHRNRIIDIYQSELGSWALRPELQYWRFNFESEQQSEIIANVFRQGYFASTHYAPIANMFGDQRTFSNATQTAGRIVNLFTDFRVSEHQAVEVCQIIRRVLDNGDSKP